MNTYYLKRIRRRFEIVNDGQLWLLNDKKRKRVSAHASHGIAMYYMFEYYFGVFTFLSWIKRARKRHMTNMHREIERLEAELPPTGRK